MTEQKEYEAVIGLEAHVQLKTASKMFTRAPFRYGEPPNTLTDPVVLGMPGTLPVLNKTAVAKAIQVGLIFGCDIAGTSKWDRKSYWYPDMPKNYQISQYDQPLCRGGEVEIELPGPSRNVMGEHKKIRLNRIHLEEDVGKLTHFGNGSLIDFNRAGAPLLEIVTEPDIHTAEEAYAFLTGLRMAIVNAGLSDCDMEKGQMRCDANVSVRPAGETRLGTKVELKNMNTITGVRNGLGYEINRQIRLCREGRAGEIVQETRRWDGGRGMTAAMRVKEESHDYRYFPDPDLMPVKITPEWLEELKAQLPEAPFGRQRRYFKQYGLPYTITSVLCPDRELCGYFEKAAAAHDNPRAIANYIANDLLRELAAAGTEGPLPLAECKIQPAQLAALVKLTDDGVLSKNAAQEVFIESFKTGEHPETVVDRKGLKQTSDTGEIEQLCREAIAGNAKAAAQFKAGQEKAINALKGPVMKATKGKANPEIVDGILRKLLAE